MNMPSVPKADLIAVAQAVIAVAVAFGAPLNADQQKSLLALSTVIAAILVTADVKRRGNRAANADKIAAATKDQPVPPPFTGTASTGSGSYQIYPGGPGTAGVTISTGPKPRPPATAAKKKQAPKKKP